MDAHLSDKTIMTSKRSGYYWVKTALARTEGADTGDIEGLLEVTGVLSS